MTMPAYLTDDCWTCVLHRNRLLAIYAAIGIAVAAVATFLPVVVLPYIALIVTATLIVAVQEHSH